MELPQVCYQSLEGVNWMFSPALANCIAKEPARLQADVPLLADAMSGVSKELWGNDAVDRCVHTVNAHWGAVYGLYPPELDLAPMQTLPFNISAARRTHDQIIGVATHHLVEPPGLRKREHLLSVWLQESYTPDDERVAVYAALYKQLGERIIHWSRGDTRRKVRVLTEPDDVFAHEALMRVSDGAHFRPGRKLKTYSIGNNVKVTRQAWKFVRERR